MCGREVAITHEGKLGVFLDAECANNYLHAAEERDELRLQVQHFENLDKIRLQQILTATIALSHEIDYSDGLSIALDQRSAQLVEALNPPFYRSNVAYYLGGALTTALVVIVEALAR